MLLSRQYLARKSRIPALLVSLAALQAPRAAAESLILNPVKDATLFQDSVDFASGVASFIFAGPIASGSPRRALLEFDVSGIPPGAIVTSVRLRLIVNRTAPGAGADTFSVHRVSADWGEGASDGGTGGGGTQATAGDATWRSRFHGAPPGTPQVPWLVQGGEFAATASASTVFSGNDAFTFGSTPLLVSDVSAWLASPGANHGWILIGPEGDVYFQLARRLISRESPSVNDRPLLTIEYTLPPPAAVRVPMLPTTGLLLAALSLLAVASRAIHRRITRR